MSDREVLVLRVLLSYRLRALILRLEETVEQLNVALKLLAQSEKTLDLLVRIQFAGPYVPLPTVPTPLLTLPTIEEKLTPLFIKTRTSANPLPSLE